MGKKSADLTNPANLIQVLQMLTANDTKVVKNGEKLLKPFTKKPAHAVILIQVLRTCEIESVRHHAALILRKNLNAYYSTYGRKEQNELKAEMLRLLLAEPVSVVATAIAGGVAAIADAVFSSKQTWDELFTLLVSLSQDPQPQLRVLTHKLLNELCETIAPHLKVHTQTLAQLFMIGCQDAVSGVAVEALRATASYIKAIGNSEEVMLLSSVIQPMVAVLGKCLQEGNENVVIEGLDVLQDCFGLEEPLINEHIEIIAEFAFRIIAIDDAEEKIAGAAVQTIVCMLQYRPKLFAKKGLVAPTLSLLMGIIARADPAAFENLFKLSDELLEEDKEDDDDDDDDEYNPLLERPRYAQMLIDYMAVNIPAKYFLEISLSMINQGLTSPDPQMRKAGCAVLGVIAEGAADKLRECLEMILPALLHSFQDPEFFVRECACFALGQFAEFLQPEILQHHQSIIPVVFETLNDSHSTIQCHGCYILENFCENLQPKTLRPWLEGLMGKLIMLFQAESSQTKEMALSAIASAAVASEREFLPYADGTCRILQPYLFVKERKYFNLRGRSLECLGHIAIALGSELFAPYFEAGMQSATEGSTLDDDDLKEHSFLFIANVAKAVKGGMQPYLSNILTYLFDFVEESEIVHVAGESGIEIEDDDDDEQEGGETTIADDDDDDEDFGDYRLNITEGFVNTKRSAVTAVGALAEHTREHFVPYIEKAIESLTTEDIGSMYSHHESIRAESVGILQHMVSSACAGMGINAPAPAGTVLPLNDFTAHVTRTCLITCLKCVTEDEDKAPVAHALESIDGILKTVGIVALQMPDDNTNGPQMIIVRLMNTLLEVISEKTKCQTALAADAQDEDDGNTDDEDVVLSAATDIMVTLAQLLRQDFVPYFDEFHKLLLKFTKPSRSYFERAMAIGVYAEVLGKIGEISLKYAEVILPIVQAGLNDPMEGVRRNAAVCIGSLVESGGAAMHPHIMTFLTWLHPLCVRKDKHRISDSGGADVDNALSAVTKMIQAAPAQVPLQQVLPAFLQALPLSDDHLEGPPIYQCLTQLVQRSDPTALSLLPQFVAAFGETLNPNSSAKDETKVICASALRGIAQTAEGQTLVQGFAATIEDPTAKQLFHQLVYEIQ